VLEGPEMCKFCLYSDLAGMLTSPTQGTTMTIEARYAAETAFCLEMQAMYSAVYLEKFPLTETAGYSAWT
jgi:hypothetical protein